MSLGLSSFQFKPVLKKKDWVAPFSTFRKTQFFTEKPFVHEKSYGRPFFVCPNKAEPCSFWVWGDVEIPSRQTCRHRLLCIIRKVKKEGLNKDRNFLCCPNDKETPASSLNGHPLNLTTTQILHSLFRSNQQKRNIPSKRNNT